MIFLSSLFSGFTSLLFLFTKTPLAMALVIIIQTIMMSFSAFLVLPTSWYSFILFMVFASAMMVIFVYISSLASNDFFSANYSTIILCFPFMLLASVLFWLFPISFLNPLTYFSLNEFTLTSLTIYKIYTNYISLLTLFLIIYLLIALIIVAKNSITLKGPLRSF